MNIHFDFLSLFREKAGIDKYVLCLPAGRGQELYTVLLALKELEKSSALKGIRILETDRLRKGVLLFVKNPSGGLRQVFNPGDQRLEEEPTIVQAAAMAGG